MQQDPVDVAAVAIDTVKPKVFFRSSRNHVATTGASRLLESTILSLATDLGFGALRNSSSVASKDATCCQNCRTLRSKF
jgi:hypothetical protein